MNRFEQQAHIAIFRWIKTVSPSTICFHPANGGLRSKREAALFKALGVLPGVPDLVLFCEAPGPCVALLEIKAPGAYLSTAQKAFRAQVETMGVPYAVVHSIDETRAVFKEWLIRTREVAPELPLRSANQEAISQGLKFYWKRRKKAAA